MDDIEDVATTKIGGVPAWAWAIGVVALIVGYVWWRNRSANAAATEAIPNDMESVSGNGSLAGASPTSGVTSDSTVPTTQQGWLQAALTSAEQAGADPLTALNALNSFLAGEPLSTSQQSIVSSAIGSQGVPPGYAGTVPTDTNVTTSSTTGSTTTVSGTNPFLAQIATISQDIAVDKAVQQQRNTTAASLEAEAAHATGSEKAHLLAQATDLRSSATAEQKNIDIDTNTLTGLQSQSAAWTG